MDVWMAMPLLKELCGGLAFLGAGTTVEAANVGGYLLRARWVMKCRNPVKGVAAGPSVVIVAETQDVIIHISYMDIMHVIVRHLELAMGVTQLVSIISLAVMDMISIMSHQGASCDSVALSGGRTRSVVLAPVMTVGMVIVILILLNLILSRALWVASGGRGSTPCRLLFVDLLFLALPRRLPPLASVRGVTMEESRAEPLAAGWMPAVLDGMLLVAALVKRASRSGGDRLNGCICQARDLSAMESASLARLELVRHEEHARRGARALAKRRQQRRTRLLTTSARGRRARTLTWRTGSTNLVRFIAGEFVGAVARLGMKTERTPSILLLTASTRLYAVGTELEGTAMCLGRAGLRVEAMRLSQSMNIKVQGHRKPNRN